MAGFTANRNLIEDVEDEYVALSAFIASKADHYEYETLEGQSQDTFRLLLLEPGRRNDPLRGSLFATRHSVGIEYVALSYLWGDAKGHNFIWIEGKCLIIGANLSKLLRELRHSSDAFTLWTDAICIDQGNLSERGHQVRLMGDIYRNASKTYASLGEETHDIAILTSFLAQQDVARASEEAPVERRADARPVETARRWFTRKKSSSASTSVTAERVGSLKFNVRDALGHHEASKIIHPLERQARLVFLDLCQRAYWTRTWIVQEIVLAQSVVLCLGDIRITWRDFTAMMDSCALQWRVFIAWNLPEEMNLIQNLIEMTERPLESRYSPLEILLQRYSMQACLDLRDRIYALLSLATNCETIIPDYTQNRLDLFFEVKDIVHNHSELRRALDLQVDEIRYRADTLQIHWTDNDGDISVAIDEALIPIDRSLDVWFDRDAETKKRVKRRAWEVLSDGYAHWARTSCRAWLWSVYGPSTICEKYQTLRARAALSRGSGLWEVQLEDGVSGELHERLLELWTPASNIERWQPSGPPA